MSPAARGLVATQPSGGPDLLEGSRRQCATASGTVISRIVATYGGGTGLPTQRECLELLGCYGKGKVRKLAEICAATVLAGDTSLTSAILAGHWVTSHDRLGRNR